MLNKVPAEGPYNEDPSLQPEIRDVGVLLETINLQIQRPITYNDSVQIGTPINAILAGHSVALSGTFARAVLFRLI